MHQLKRQTRLDPITRLAAPSAEQVPRAQPQVLGDQKPKTDQISRYLVGQELSQPAFQTDRIAGLHARAP
jgi:hypothetical protein